MLTKKPTQRMINEWKRIFEAKRNELAPNRKSGLEIDLFFRNHYSHKSFDDVNFQKMVTEEILENEYSRNKLNVNTLPNIKSYKVGDTMVGIDINSGEFHVEGIDIKSVASIHDELFVYRGLDKEDLTNFFLVAEYVKLTENNKMFN